MMTSNVPSSIGIRSISKIWFTKFKVQPFKTRIEKDKNEPELTYHYKEVDPLSSPPPAFESKPDDKIEVETVPASVYKVEGKRKDKFYGKLILELGNEARSSVEQGTTAMEKLVEKVGNTEDKVECKNLKKELEEARGFVFEERPNEAINVPIEDEKSPSSESRGSPPDL
nr:hypothetical protein [Tanacetum cinerariifolium]